MNAQEYYTIWSKLYQEKTCRGGMAVFTPEDIALLDEVANELMSDYSVANHTALTEMRERIDDYYLALRELEME